MAYNMKKVHQVVYNRMKDDSELATLLGGSTTGRVSWINLPSNPLYPSIIYRQLTTTSDKIFEFNSLKTPMVFSIDVYDDTPSPETITDIKQRITELFHNQEAALTTLAVDDTGKLLLHFYNSEVVDDIGDGFLDSQDRWFTTLRIEFIVQLVCENS
jgi:hypothetical protein